MTPAEWGARALRALEVAARESGAVLRASSVIVREAVPVRPLPLGVIPDVPARVILRGEWDLGDSARMTAAARTGNAAEFPVDDDPAATFLRMEEAVDAVVTAALRWGAP